MTNAFDLHVGEDGASGGDSRGRRVSHRHRGILQLLLNALLVIFLFRTELKKKKKERETESERESERRRESERSESSIQS